MLIIRRLGTQEKNKFVLSTVADGVADWSVIVPAVSCATILSHDLRLYEMSSLVSLNRTVYIIVHRPQLLSLAICK